MLASNPVTTNLIKAREFISEPEHWTIGQLACDSKGKEARPNEQTAYSFCALGALNKVGVNHWTSSNERPPEIQFLLQAAREAEPEVYSVAAYNNTHSHQEVLEMFDRAIQISLEGTQA